MSGPGSKPLLFALLLAVGADVAVPKPSWVSYAAQAALAGARPHFVPVPPGEGGICDPSALARAVTTARAAGRRIGSVIVTLPDNPTGQPAQPATVRALCEVAARHDLVIISDEIYRDLIYDTARPFLSPAKCAPERTVVTTTLSKSLALGGWRAGAARLPDSPAGRALCGRALGIASENWSATAARSSTPPPRPSPSPRNLPNGSPAAGPCTRRSAAPWRAGSPPPGWMSGHRRPPSTSTPVSAPGAARWPPITA